MLTSQNLEESRDDTIEMKKNDGNTNMLVNSSELAVVHVVSSTHTVTMTPFRKLSVLNRTFSRKVSNDITSQIPAGEKAEVYQQRKRMVQEYKELFAALMRLPDKELQKKLLDVINNHHHSLTYRTVETQTDLAVPTNILREVTNDDASNDTCSNGSENGTPRFKSKEIVKKRKRKRKVSLPQANKESRTKQLAKINKPKAANINSISNIKNETEMPISPKRQRINSFCISDWSSDIANIYDDTETNHTREIQQCSYPLENGLLPIQDAVLRNQTNKLLMNILIWQSYNDIDLNDILTEEDEDLLQLAILNSCDPSIVSLLLIKGLNPNTFDADSNTIIHLAILNDITVESLDHLMRYIDLKILLTLNDDGYTPLHLAVRQDRYLLAECLINALDERLVEKRFFKRPVDELETDEVILKNRFKDYYENICEQLSVSDERDSYVFYNHDLKQKLLQAGDSRSGNTALYFAIDIRLEHLIYFLLAHFTDPRTENLSGLDCKTYVGEFGKSLNLSSNIDITMDKVIKVLS